MACCVSWRRIDDTILSGNGSDCQQKLWRLKIFGIKGFGVFEAHPGRFGNVAALGSSSF